MKLMKLMKLMKITVIRSIEVITKLRLLEISRHLFLSESKNIEVLAQNCEVLIKLLSLITGALRSENPGQHSEYFLPLEFYAKTSRR